MEASSYPASVLVSLQSKMKHLARLVALLVHELVADRQQPREAGLDNLVKVLPVVAVSGPITEGATEGEQALQTSQDRARIVGVEKLHGEVDVSRPACGKVALQHALEDGDKLLADERLGAGEEGDEAVSHASLLLLWNRRGLVGLLARLVPGMVDSVLYIDDSC